MRHVLLALSLYGLAYAQPMKYPAPRKSDVADNYHGTRVADPYRWLEDTDSPETARWIADENRVTQEYISRIPARARIKDRLTTLYNYERFNSISYAGGGRYLVFRNDGLQNQDVLYVADSPAGTPRVLLDPNTLRADGTAAISGLEASHDGRLLAYAVADAGSDWMQWHVREIATGKDLPDVVKWAKFSGASWTPDGRAFYYQRFAEPKPGEALRAENVFGKLYLHRLGEPQSADKLVYERPDQKQWMFEPEVTEDGRYLVISVETTDFGRNLVFYQELRPGAKTVELVRELKGLYAFLGNEGPVFYFRTTDAAPKGRIVAIDVTRPERARWREVVPEQPEPIDSARMVRGKLVISYLKDAASALKVFGTGGRLVKEVALPGIGQAALLGGRTTDPELFFLFSSYTAPRAIYRLDPAAASTSVVRQSKVAFDPAQFETERVFCTGKDGARIPMALVHRKGIQRDGGNPTLLYGYGGFNVSVLPDFSANVIEFLEMGGMYAVANIRGGAEYGDAWHEAGKREKKQTVFDDFIAAAEWLIAQKYTSTPKLAIFGGSNGGLLVGAVLNQRPDLFGAAMPAVGVMDMLRFQKFTIGAAWVDEYGSSDDPAQLKTLLAYSPLHNITPGTKYPAVLITTSDHDDRVVPGHSFKYAATLQAAQADGRPILIRIETRAGHGAGKPVTKIIDEWADRLAFLSKELGT